MSVRPPGGSRNVALVSTMLNVVVILTGLFILLVYQLMFVSFFDPLIEQVVGTYEFQHLAGKEIANNLFGVSTGTVVWVAGAALVVVGLVNEYRRRRTVTRQRLR